jgi:hypothetical protein
VTAAASVNSAPPRLHAPAERLVQPLNAVGGAERLPLGTAWPSASKARVIRLHLACGDTRIYLEVHARRVGCKGWDTVKQARLNSKS